MLWQVSDLQRVRHCGRVPVSNSGSVELRSTGGLAGYSGLQHCGSVWACPVCASRILVSRALEIGCVLGEAIRRGHPLGFVTLTMRHGKGQRLMDLWAGAAKGWTRSISGRAWVSVEESVEGWVRVWEVTYGSNGWHVHVHLVLVLAPDADCSDLEVVASGMFERWSRGLVAAGLEAPMLKGQDWHMATGEKAASDLADYLAKSVELGTMEKLVQQARREALATGLGLELTHTSSGRAREDLRTRPVWSLLDDLAETGEIGLWREWERGSKGRQQVGWSNGLRKRFAPALDEQTDQQIVDQALGDESDTIVSWTSEQWRTFIAHPTRAVELLEAAQFGGRLAVVDLLESWADVSCSIIETVSPGEAGGAGGRSEARPPAPSAPPLIGSGPTSAVGQDRLDLDGACLVRGVGRSPAGSHARKLESGSGGGRIASESEPPAPPLGDRFYRSTDGVTVSPEPLC